MNELLRCNRTKKCTVTQGTENPFQSSRLADPVHVNKTPSGYDNRRVDHEDDRESKVNPSSRFGVFIR